jgi:chromosome segregation ATPase
MTNEEIQRVMEFIIKQQESFAEGMERMRRSHEMAEERTSQLETAAIHLYNAVAELNQAQRDLTVKMAELAEAQRHYRHHRAGARRKISDLRVKVGAASEPAVPPAAPDEHA